MSKVLGSKPSGRRQDGLALSRALPDRSLMAMVAAMSFLACLTLAGAFGMRDLSARWANGAANLVTILIPEPVLPSDDATAQPGPAGQTDAAAPRAGSPAPDTRDATVLAVLKASPAVAAVHRLDATEIDRLLSPWLGAQGSAALPLPTVLEVHLAPGAVFPPALAQDLAARNPGLLVERNDDWRERLHAIAGSLLVCAAVALLIVGAIGAAVIGMATRMGLGARRESITILHGLGAADGYVASRFARRVAGLAFAGGTVGAMLSLPPLATLARLMAPLSWDNAPAVVTGDTPSPSPAMTGGLEETFATLWVHASLPSLLLWGLALVPFVSAFIGWATAQGMVRIWLRRLP